MKMSDQSTKKKKRKRRRWEIIKGRSKRIGNSIITPHQALAEMKIET